MTSDSSNATGSYRNDIICGQKTSSLVMDLWVRCFSYHFWLPSYYLTSFLFLFFFVVNYLLNYRLQWGRPDTLSLLTSALDKPQSNGVNGDATNTPASLMTDPAAVGQLPLLPPDAPAYFTSDTPAEYLSIIQNDWPYSGTSCPPKK